jgi:hypothetical protein
MEEMERHLPEGICDAMRGVLAGLEGYFDGAPKEEVSFTKLFGSPMFLVEEVEELAQVRSFEQGPAGRFSVLDAPSQWFDVAEWIEAGEFALLMTIESCDGGPRYYIPRKVADQAPNVAESIRLKHRAA